MTKKGLSEADICAKYITPCLIQSGWDEATQIRREVTFTKGRIIVRGRLVTRGKAKRADYVLYYQHIPIAIIEAKDNNDDLFKNEAADLMYHFLVLLAEKNIRLEEVLQVLRERHS